MNKIIITVVNSEGQIELGDEPKIVYLKKGEIFKIDFFNTEAYPIHLLFYKDYSNRAFAFKIDSYQHFVLDLSFRSKESLSINHLISIIISDQKNNALEEHKIFFFEHGEKKINDFYFQDYICPKCGSKLKYTWKFCPQCGVKL